MTVRDTKITLVHNFTRTSKDCDCGENGCHGHPVHTLRCSCGWVKGLGPFGLCYSVATLQLEHVAREGGRLGKSAA